MIVLPREIADHVGRDDVVVWDGDPATPPGGTRFYVPSYMAGEWAFEAMRLMPDLEVCQLPTAGFEHALAHLPGGVTLCNAAGVHDASTAELAVGLILARLRRIQALGEAGMNLAGIERVLDLERQLDRATARVRELEREVARRSAEHERAMDATRRAMSTEIVHVRTAASPPAVRVKRVIPAGLRPVPRPTDTRDPRRSR